MAMLRVPAIGLAVLVCAALVLCAAAADDAKGDTAKVELKGGRRSIKDWSKLTDKDFRDLEDTWMDDEEEDPDDLSFKWTKGPNGERQPPQPKGPKMEMGFATLQPGTRKEQCERLASQWSQLLSTGSVAVKAYAIEDDKILVGVEGGYTDMFKVKEFVLDRPEVTEFEWQQQKFFPKHAKRSAKQTADDAAAEERRAKEAEMRRKLESGELFAKGKGKAKAAAKPAPAPAKGKAKTKAAAKKEAATKPAKAAGDKKQAKEKVKAKPAPAKAKAKDVKEKAKPKDAATKPKRDEL